MLPPASLPPELDKPLPSACLPPERAPSPMPLPAACSSPERAPSPMILPPACLCRRPHVCAVRPPVPVRRKPKFQYSRSKSIVPTEMPPISVAAESPQDDTAPTASATAPKCPTTAISTIPTSGTVIPARMLGTARRSISLLSLSTLLLRNAGYLNFLSSSSIPR